MHFSYVSKSTLYIGIIDVAGADPGFGQGGIQLPKSKVANVVKRALSGQGTGPT